MKQSTISENEIAAINADYTKFKSRIAELERELQKAAYREGELSKDAASERQGRLSAERELAEVKADAESVRRDYSVGCTELRDERDRLRKALEDTLSQLSTMLERSNRYKSEAESDRDFDEGEKHARVSSVLRELLRLGESFKARALASVEKGEANGH